MVAGEAAVDEAWTGACINTGGGIDGDRSPRVGRISGRQQWVGGEDTPLNEEITRPQCSEGRRGWLKEKVIGWKGGTCNAVSGRNWVK